MYQQPEDKEIIISPREFELQVKDYLDGLSGKLKSYKSIHDINLKSHDGDYQIDIYAEFEYLDVIFKVIIECKRHKSKVKREVVQLLYDKIRALGVNKGIVFSYNGFQEGAVTFAKEHGIALISLMEGRYTYHTRSAGPQEYNPPISSDIPKYVGVYRIDDLVCYLSKNNLERLSEFLFGHNGFGLQLNVK